MFLSDFYNDIGPERVGFIKNNGEIVEVENVAEDPESGFAVQTGQLIELDGQIKASWHTHPGQHSNLSMEDYYTFKAWPHLAHYILGQDGIRCYTVRNGSVILEDSSSTRAPERDNP